MTDIDWKRELRNIERQFDGLPPEPSASVVKARKVIEQREKERLEHRAAVIGATGRLVLVTTLLAGLFWWPYAADCGVFLAGFLAAQTMIVVGGLWSALYAWRHRLGASHTIALLLLLTGLALVAAQVLPRLGYGTLVWATGMGWRCGA